MKAILGPQELQGVGKAGVRVRQLQSARPEVAAEAGGTRVREAPLATREGSGGWSLGLRTEGQGDDGEVGQGGAPGTRVESLEPWGH